MLWPFKRACIYSSSEELCTLLKGILQHLGWATLHAQGHWGLAKESILRSKTCLLILDDTLEQPVSWSMRALMQHSALLLTPCLVFVREGDTHEITLLQSLPTIETTPKPFSVHTFMPAFQRLLKKWEQTPWISVRQQTALALKVPLPDQAAFWMPLRHIADMHLLFACVLSLHFRMLHMYTMAEKTLLEAFKKDPKQIIILLCLGDLYLESGMFSFAKKFYATVSRQLPHASSLYGDMIQVGLLTQNFAEVLRLQQKAIKLGHSETHLHPILAKLRILRPFPEKDTTT